MKGVICYLLINKIPKLPRLAIESALQNTGAEIYVGYLNRSDLSDLPVNPRIHFIDLNEQAIEKNLLPESSGYISFDQDFFFQLVQLKWELFHLVLSETHADFLVYLDLDVVVLKDLVTEFERTFVSLPNVEVLVQDFTHEPSVPRLCMGVFAIKRGSFSRRLLQKCSLIHSETLTTNPRFGDDDVITEVYADVEFKHAFLRLPQHSFPVGILVNLFLPFSPLRGLRPPKPFVFHSNFVVGVQKKYLLLELIYYDGKRFKIFRITQTYIIILKDLVFRKFRGFKVKIIRGVRGI
jgi:hypothetical protein